MSTGGPVGLGWKAHTGWAVVVALADPGSGLEIVASVIASGTGKALPPLEAILKSHALVHAAEGELFRRILANAGESCRIPSAFAPARELPSRAARAAGISEARLAVRLASLGKASGRPWAQDHEEATLAAWIALSRPRRERS